MGAARAVGLAYHRASSALYVAVLTMPQAAYRECNRARCPKYATRDGYCEDHQSYIRDQIAGPTGSGLTNSNHRFRTLRAAFLRAHPMCVECGTAVATVLDHRTPHRGNSNLFWSQANWPALC